MWYGYLADFIVGVHVAYVSYVVVGLLLILLGLALRWKWVRNRWFRLTHLLAITVVALEAIFDIECPLTVWERELRGLAGQTTDDATFMGRLLHNLVFYDLPPWAFTIIYIAFALVVLGAFLLAPPRWRGRPPAKAITI